METTKDHIESKWEILLNKLEKLNGKRLDLDGLLFLIGVQELGQGLKEYSKEEKTDLMHIAVCKLFSFSGYYTLIGEDEDGWPHWELIKKIPGVDIFSQEKLLKQHIIEYFDQIGFTAS